MSVWTTEDARVKHAGQTLIVRVTRDTGRFQWTIDARVAVIEESVLVVWSPTWPSIFVDFDLDHLLDAVHNARDTDLLLRLGSWLCLWLLLHLFSLKRWNLSQLRVLLQKLSDRCRNGRSFLCTLPSLPPAMGWDSSS